MHAAARVVAAFGLAAAIGCDPTPTFPPAEQPLPGVVVLEREMIAAAGVPIEVSFSGVTLSIPADASLLGATLSIPADAVPPGTRVLVRYLRDVRKTLDGSTHARLWTLTGQPAALQILPETLTFAKPATLSVFGYPLTQPPAEVLSANEADPAWQRRGAAPYSIPPAPPGLVAIVDGPHLWSFFLDWTGQPAVQSGAFVQQQLSCANVPVDPTPVDNLTIGADRTYVWTRAARGGACGGVETGLVTLLDWTAGVAFFGPSGGGAKRKYGLQAKGDGFLLQGQFAEALDCAAYQVTLNWFVPAVTGADGGVPSKGATDGACAIDAPTEANDGRVD
jgi:hypothetical protein